MDTALNKVSVNEMFTNWTAIEFNSHGYVTVLSFGEKTYESGAGDLEESVLLDSVPITVCKEILTKQERKRLTTKAINKATIYLHTKGQ